MMLKSLELTGFKSFAKKTSLRFETPITAIVGPNGSGKSNIADAFRFVLGEQSMKSLRGKRGEDMIFNGSKTISRSNRASIALLLDNKDHVLNLDYAEVQFERIVHRDASFEYLVNGSSVRLKDVQEMIAHANIGSSGHHIISQGEADRILSMGPTERKDSIEDSLGLRVFHFRIQDTLKRLEKTRENINKVELHRKELQLTVRSLEYTLKQLNDASFIEKDLLDLYKLYFMEAEFWKNNIETKIEEERKYPEAQVIDLNKRISLLVQKQSNLLTQAESTITDTDVLHHKEILKKDIEKALKDTISKKAEIQYDIVHLKKDLFKLQDEIASEAKNKEFTGGELRAFKRHCEDIIEKIQITQSFEEIRRFAKTLKDIIIHHTHTIDTNELKERSIATQEKIEDLENQFSVFEYNVAKLEDERKSVEKEIIDVHNRKSEVAFEKVALENQLLQLEQEKSLLLTRLGNLDSVRSDLLSFKRELDERVKEAIRVIGPRATYQDDMSLSDVHKDELRSLTSVPQFRNHALHTVRQIDRLVVKLEGVDLGSLHRVEKEYKEIIEKDTFMERELHDLFEAERKTYDMLGELRMTLRSQFELGVKKINYSFDDFFKTVFGGGRAEIKTEYSLQTGEPTGVLIDVDLPYKKIRGIEVMSGGERALTSIALLFALALVTPPPFIILDETDAALDEANSKRYGDMLEKLSSHTQLIIITHNRETMSRAGVLYGVTMGSDGVSRLLSIKLTDAAHYAK